MAKNLEHPRISARQQVAERVLLARTLAGYARSRERFEEFAASKGFELTARRVGGMERAEIDVQWSDIVALGLCVRTAGWSRLLLATAEVKAARSMGTSEVAYPLIV